MKFGLKKETYTREFDHDPTKLFGLYPKESLVFSWHIGQVIALFPNVRPLAWDPRVAMFL